MDRISEDRHSSDLFPEENEQNHDSGCGLDTTPEDDTMPSMQTSSPNSETRETAPQPSPSKSGLSRRERYRRSLQRLKEKSAKFFRREVRPSCMRTESFDRPEASGEGPPRLSGPVKAETEEGRRRESVVMGGRRTKSAPMMMRNRLVRQQELSSNESFSDFPLPRRDSSVKSVHSETSSSTSENQGIIWTKEPSCSSIHQSPEDPIPSPPTSGVMNSYQQVLDCVVNPLGCPDRSGFTKDDLITYLQELFKVNKDIHETTLAQIQNCKQQCEVVLDITIFEAKDLKPCGTVESTNPSCVFGIDALQSPVSTPSASPSVTPSTRRKHRLSIDSITVCDDIQRLDGRFNSIIQLGLERLDMPRRSLRKRTQSSLELEELIHTETIKSTTNPTWNEKFQLNVHDINSEVLHLFVWHQPTVTPTENQERFSHRSRPSFKSLFRHLRLSQDGGRSLANCLGQIRIPLKDIPTSGSRKWYQLYRDKRQKMAQSGQINLGLHLSFKSMSSTPTDESRLKGLHGFIQRIYEHELNGGSDSVDGLGLGQSESCSEEPTTGLHQMISQQTIRCVLNQFAQHQNISLTSQKLLELAVILEAVVNGCSMSESFLTEKISGFCESCSTEEVEKLTSYEINSLNNSISAYFELTKRQLASSRASYKFFPWKDINLEDLESKTRVAVSLMNISIIDGIENSSADLVSYLAKCIQTDVREWLVDHVEAVKASQKDPVLEKTRLFVEVLRSATVALTPENKVANFFNGLGIDYYRMVSMVAETKLSSKAKELTLEMDKYQIRYNRFDVNISESSAVSLQHYFTLRNLFKTIRANVSERELFRISLSDYQNWFKVSVTFWLQTFREQCLSRMETALTLDKDVVQVTSLVKHSNSSVDVLSCFNTMATEWREIDFADTDIALLGVTKITDTICDCVKAYIDKVIEILEHNGYYDYIDNQQFDVTDRLCISLNNICHLSQYLSQLSTQLNWVKVTNQLSLRHENDDIGKQALKMLHSLVLTTDEEVQAQGRILAKQIIDKMAVDLQKNTMFFTRCPSGKTPEVESLLEYLEGNMNVLFQKLESVIFPIFWEEIWKTEIRIITQTLAEGKPASYYKDVAIFLESVRDFFERGGVEHCRNRSCRHYCHLLKVLEMNSLSSEELILQYYRSLAEVAGTPSDYYGHLVVKVGYRQKTDDLVSIHISVIQGKDLPGMTNANLSNPYICISLCPSTMFSEAEKFHTPVAKGTVNPVYGENYEFKFMTKKHLLTPGAVVLFSTWHYVPLFANDFLGEIVIPFSGIRELVGRQTVDDLPAIMMPLRRPKEPKTGPYKVLKDRSANDKVAQMLVNQRNKEVVFRTRCNLCRPVKCLVSTLTGKKLEVIGKQASISME